MIFIARQSRAIPTAIGIMILALFGIMPSVHAQAPEGTLKWWAARAKAKGLDHAEIVNFGVDTQDMGSLHEALQTHFLLVVTAETTETKQTLTDRSIFTWYRLHVNSIMSSPPHKWPCDAPLQSPFAAPLANDEIAVALPVGTALVDGFKITMLDASSPSRFEPGKDYLLIANVCADRTAFLRPGLSSIYTIDRTGAPSTMMKNGRALIAEEIENQHTLARLGAHVKSQAFRAQK